MSVRRALFQLGCVCVALAGGGAALCVRAVPLGQRALTQEGALGAGLYLSPPLSELEMGPSGALRGAHSPAPVAPLALSDGARLRVALLAPRDLDPRPALSTLRAGRASHPSALRPLQATAERRLGGRLMLLSLRLDAAGEAARTAAAAARLSGRLDTAQAALERATAKATRAEEALSQALAQRAAEWTARRVEREARADAEVARVEGEARLEVEQARAALDAEAERWDAEAELAEARADARVDALTATALATDAGRLHLALEAVRGLPPGSLKGRTLADWRAHFLPPR